MHPLDAHWSVLSARRSCDGALSPLSGTSTEQTRCQARWSRSDGSRMFEPRDRTHPWRSIPKKGFLVMSCALLFAGSGMWRYSVCDLRAFNCCRSSKLCLFCRFGVDVFKPMLDILLEQSSANSSNVEYDVILKYNYIYIKSKSPRCAESPSVERSARSKAGPTIHLQRRV